MNHKKFAQSILLVAVIAVPTMTIASEELAQANNCLACHAVDQKLGGPAFNEIAAKYKGDAAAAALLADKIKNGGSGTWGQVPMPPNPAVSDADIATLVDWVLSL